MGRWSQFEDDLYRLPEGMKRIAYDADARVYTFRDDKGKLYRGPPGEEYGRLTPIDTGTIDRPNAFDSGNAHTRQVSLNSRTNPSSFRDILPGSDITSEKAPIDGKWGRPSTGSPFSFSTNGNQPSPREQFVNAVRRTALPKMQGVVYNLRRSMLDFRRQPVATESEDTDRLLGRSPSLSTTRS